MLSRLSRVLYDMEKMVNNMNVTYERIPKPDVYDDVTNVCTYVICCNEWNGVVVNNPFAA